MSGTQGGFDPQGHGTHGGGGPLNVTNQPILPLDPHIFCGLDPAQCHELAIVQAEFARNVARQTVEAYDRVLAILAKSGARGEF